ncbi:hypothetical protein D3C77_628300 [compost metagenome]
MLHDHRLDRMVIMEPEQEFDCSVLRFELCNFIQSNEGKLVVQLLAERLRQVRHFIERVYALCVEPIKDLPSAKSWLSLLDSPIAQLFISVVVYKRFHFHTPVL